jgi:hypothetical protein
VVSLALELLLQFMDGGHSGVHALHGLWIEQRAGRILDFDRESVPESL